MQTLPEQPLEQCGSYPSASGEQHQAGQVEQRHEAREKARRAMND